MALGLLRTILILMLFYYGFKFLVRLLAPFLLKRFMQGYLHKRFHQHYSNQYHKEKEGKVTLESEKKQQNSTQDLGEYVDFEELD